MEKVKRHKENQPGNSQILGEPRMGSPLSSFSVQAGVPTIMVEKPLLYSTWTVEIKARIWLEPLDLETCHNPSQATLFDFEITTGPFNSH